MSYFNFDGQKHEEQAPDDEFSGLKSDDLRKAFEEINSPSGGSVMDRVVRIMKILGEHAAALNLKGLPPVGVVECDGKIRAVAVSNQVSKESGLSLAHILRQGFNPTSLVVVFDTFMRVEKSEAEHEKFVENCVPGSLQERYEAGDEGVCQCLVCYRLGSDGSREMVMLPYETRGGLRWLDVDAVAEAQREAQNFGGAVPDAFKEIMDKPLAVQSDEFIRKFRDEKNIDEEKAWQMAGRAAVLHLRLQGCLCYDLDNSSQEHTLGLFETLMNKVKDFPGSDEELRTKVKGIVRSASANLRETKPEEFKLNEDEVAQLADMFAELIVNERRRAGKRESRREYPYRVRVWNGDQSDYLGEGDLVGEVDVYYVRTAAGEIEAPQQPEILPVDLPEGASVIRAGKNPKIVLDSGRTVYGCQVWWDPIDD